MLTLWRIQGAEALGTHIPVQFLPFSCSLRQKSCQIIGFHPKLRDWSPRLGNSGSATVTVSVNKALIVPQPVQVNIASYLEQLPLLESTTVSGATALYVLIQSTWIHSEFGLHLNSKSHAPATMLGTLGSKFIK